MAFIHLDYNVILLLPAELHMASESSGCLKLGFQVVPHNLPFQLHLSPVTHSSSILQAAPWLQHTDFQASLRVIPMFAESPCTLKTAHCCSVFSWKFLVKGLCLHWIPFIPLPFLPHWLLYLSLLPVNCMKGDGKSVRFMAKFLNSTGYVSWFMTKETENLRW